MKKACLLFILLTFSAVCISCDEGSDDDYGKGKTSYNITIEGEVFEGSYETEGDYNIVRLVYRLVYCQGLLALWHFIVWIPAFFYLRNFLKLKRKRGDINEAALVLIFILSYLMVFTEGNSLSFDDFITTYPFLSILAALSLQNPGSRIVENTFLK